MVFTQHLLKENKQIGCWWRGDFSAPKDIKGFLFWTTKCQVLAWPSNFPTTALTSVCNIVVYSLYTCIIRCILASFPQKRHGTNMTSQVIFDMNKLKMCLRLKPRLSKYFSRHDSSTLICWSPGWQTVIWMVQSCPSMQEFMWVPM